MRLLTLALIALAMNSVNAAGVGWPFAQAPNVAVFTQKQIISGKASVLLVTHDLDDHGWQFLNPSITATYENVSVVGLGQIVKLDPSLLEVADLPAGWRATRHKVGAEWVREKNIE